MSECAMRKKPHPVPRLHDIAAVVFDLDGVLIDSEPLHLRAANRVLARYGAEVSEADFRALIGVGAVARWEGWRGRYRIADPVEQLIAMDTAAWLAEIAADAPPIDDAVELARRLHASGMPLAIASSSTPAVIDAELTALGLTKEFTVRVSGEDPDVRYSKPAPDVYVAASARLHVAPAACLAIEDSAPGVIAAKRAGMTCLAVPNRWTAEQDFGDADVVLMSLRYFPLLVL
jgi:HAD superfamily hydrolase (TIGR01509 family)